MRVGAPGALAYVDEADLQYVAGRSLVRYDLETRQMRTSQGAAEAVSGITAVATTPNRRTRKYNWFQWAQKNPARLAPSRVKVLADVDRLEGYDRLT
jgi:hypothetical protein